MLQTIRKRLNNKGFTLVELIVVLVILAILAALLIPSLTGYIDRARQESVVAETRMVVLAAQTVLSEEYGQTVFAEGQIVYPVDKEYDGDDAELRKRLATDINELSETKGDFTITYNDRAKVLTVIYTHNGYKCTYNGATDTADANYKCEAIKPDGSGDGSDSGSGSDDTKAGESVESINFA